MRAGDGRVPGLLPTSAAGTGGGTPGGGEGLRGHGDSSLGFDRYDDEAAAGDVPAVIEALGGGPATVIGNSMGAAAGVLAAAQAPGMVDRLVLIGPFVRDHGSGVMRLLMRFMPATPCRCHMPDLHRYLALAVVATAVPDAVVDDAKVSSPR